ncbi:MAG: hypothetical protein A2845_04435 [Candidatus Lloydbacteria bacterium RIFCSPHIGHO2_01_FULL_49_22]|uniref:Uncharacterized protein n=1 Tax=Candidatus Lloydbacteria bacterium RIFCSPHIGHO2_01_FULL_49_22 TaxID=1798658 RepID=A0A1G2CUA9_9BACT|nr:MAG: hypothetical protein A2845_04435 [Candidatus Lloydbacteria bacterium RIFCSPHIGHO2_01_FULL_49_22]OGZ08898.1 MAG: hypothetical protein A3C14_01470 [Candidatus Lloydbacteria bacterium RIFCSPHIGHO2_02_FULL_50_18]
MNEKIYVGKGKVVGQYGNISFSVELDALQPHAFEYNGKRYVKLIMSQMRQPDQYGKTHTVQIDTWKPDQNAAKPEATARASTSQPVVEYPTDEDINPADIPF